MQEKGTIIKTNLPFLNGRTVLLLEDPANPIPIPQTYFWEEFRANLRRFGYGFIFLPELLADIHPVIAEYLFPGYEMPDASAIYQQIRDVSGIGDRYGFLYKIGRTTYFSALSGTGNDLNDVVGDLMGAIRESSQQRVRKLSKPIGMFGVDILPNKLERTEDICLDLPSPREEVRFRKSSPFEEELDERTIYILTDIQRFLKEHNLTLDELKVIIGYKVTLSRMEITRNGKIYLMDFVDNNTKKPKEIKMDHLTKMVYFFYLKHPEGIRIKDVDGHIEELMRLYMGITGRDDKEAIRASILNHVGPYSNNINVSMSRIKAAFKNQVDESVARFYWIEGNGGEPYRIAIDRDYVLWEYGA